MLYQQLVAILLAALFLNLLLNLRTLRRAKSDVELPEPAPLISVLIPARNEEDNIGTCLESLRRQDYPNYEILVLDDSSTDRTADIVASIAAEDPRVKLLRATAGATTAPRVGRQALCLSPVGPEGSRLLAAVYRR